MSDYVYMLESRLSPDQNRVVADVQAAAGLAGVNLFLTGGAMRDMLGGFPIRDLDFVLEGNALKVAKAVSDASGIPLVVDENRKSAEMAFPGGVTVQIAMARQERRARGALKAQVAPATIQEDLRGRDFTCNSIALSLNKASRGLLLDPMNGLADIERHELRAVSAYGFYDDPSRLLRLARLRVRLGFAVEDRTRMQVANAREAEVEKNIAAAVLGDELRRIAVEDRPAGIVQALEEDGLLTLFSPALTGAKLDHTGLAKLEKALAFPPDEPAWREARLGPFLHTFAGALSARDQATLIKTVGLTKGEVELWRKLEPRAKKLETALRSPRLKKPSQVYHLVAAAAPDEVLFLLAHSAFKPVTERLKNYFQKYLPTVQEITPEEWASIEAKPGTPRYAKARTAFVSERLDRKPPKPPEPDASEPAPPAAPVMEAARRAR